MNVGYFDGPKKKARPYGEGDGKGAADDTALDFPERQNILGRSTNQSGADAHALPQQTKGPLTELLAGKGGNGQIVDGFGSGPLYALDLF